MFVWRAGLSTTFEKDLTVVRALRGISFPSIGLVLLGLLVNLSSREEVYTSIEYGFPMLALFGAAGCIGQLTLSISRRSGSLAFACCIPVGVPLAARLPGGVRGETSDLPLLIALLFGPLVFLLAGLGGWV